MFSAVDKNRDYSVITVNKPVRIMPLRRATLGVGTYEVQGDVRSKLRHLKVRRLMEAGFFDVEFVPVQRQKVSAQTQSFTTEVAPTPALPDSESAPSTSLPGVEQKLGHTDVAEKPRERKRRKTVVPDADVAVPEEITPDMTVKQEEVAEGPKKAPEQETTKINLGQALVGQSKAGEAVGEPADSEFQLVAEVDLGDLTAEDEQYGPDSVVVTGFEEGAVAELGELVGSESPGHEEEYRPFRGEKEESSRPRKRRRRRSSKSAE